MIFIVLSIVLSVLSACPVSQLAERTGRWVILTAPFVLSCLGSRTELMPDASETDTENLYQKTGTIFRTVFFVQDETGSKISGLIFLYYCPPIHFKAIKQQTTYTNKQHNWRSSDQSILVILITVSCTE